jgi:hypothetical protein
MKTRSARFRQFACVELALVSVPAGLALDRVVHVPSEFAWLFPALGLLGLILFLNFAFRSRLEHLELSSSCAAGPNDSRVGGSSPAQESLPVDPEATWRMPLPGGTDALRARPLASLPDAGRSRDPKPALGLKSAPASIRLDPKDSWRVPVTRRAGPKTAFSEDPDATIRLNG